MEKDVGVGGRYEAQLLEERVREYWNGLKRIKKQKSIGREGNHFSSWMAPHTHPGRPIWERLGIKH